MTTPTHSAKAAGAVIGTFFGIAGAGCVFVVGLLLTLTGIGAIIGLPMMLLALLLPFFGGAIGLAMISGACPYCGASLSCLNMSPGVDCPACKQRVLVRDRQFHRIV